MDTGGGVFVVWVGDWYGVCVEGRLHLCRDGSLQGEVSCGWGVRVPPMALERPRELIVWSNSLAHVAMRSISMSRGVLSALQDHSQCRVVSGV